jgi:hypothetical protein
MCGLIFFTKFAWNFLIFKKNSASYYHKCTGWSKVCVHLTITVQNNPHTLDELKIAIKENIRNVDRAILNTVFENTVRRVNKCLEIGGGHFEHYL